MSRKLVYIWRSRWAGARYPVCFESWWGVDEGRCIADFDRVPMFWKFMCLFDNGSPTIFLLRFSRFSLCFFYYYFIASFGFIFPSENHRWLIVAELRVACSSTRGGTLRCHALSSAMGASSILLNLRPISFINKPVYKYVNRMIYWWEW